MFHWSELADFFAYIKMLMFAYNSIAPKKTSVIRQLNTKQNLARLS